MFIRASMERTIDGLSSVQDLRNAAKTILNGMITEKTAKEGVLQDLLKRGALDGPLWTSSEPPGGELEGLVRELSTALAWYVSEDDINENLPDNEYWLEGKREAIRLLEKADAVLSDRPGQGGKPPFTPPAL